ncbi:hypothetical protein Vqi01_59020 [Micromonospora qiuiae]|uniref:Uncharacterized protein n=1 Tax=Micromonospora qiuiae TaxID=502268 RepID=A0ABQ4JK41_9ACTN|nr:hypothetical protein [Micromonospora qiuiae]GIJ30740.1 hypothetical protein Vqi01_59020 [Micromonospora qiuiae]
MPHYALNDPRLQAEMELLAAETAATWPVTDHTLAALARILPTTNAMADRHVAAAPDAAPTERVPDGC